MNFVGVLAHRYRLDKHVLTLFVSVSARHHNIDMLGVELLVLGRRFEVVGHAVGYDVHIGLIIPILQLLGNKLRRTVYVVDFVEEVVPKKCVKLFYCYRRMLKPRVVSNVFGLDVESRRNGNTHLFGNIESLLFEFERHIQMHDIRTAKRVG